MNTNEQRITKIRISSTITDKVIQVLAAHPYFWAFVICIFLHPFYLGAEWNVPNNALLIETLMVFSIGLSIIYGLHKSGIVTRDRAIIITAVFLILDYVFLKWYVTLYTKGVVLLLFGFLFVLGLWYFAQDTEYKEQLNVFLIISLGFLIKLYYVYLCSCYTYQHDVHSFGRADGHAGYIEYLLFNHKLPDFDVRTRWQFAHPPLHHIICALWIDINQNILGIGHNPARESLQTLSLFYSACIVITSYRILKQFKLKGAALYIPMLIISFHPAFILFSGSINNDVLSIVFIMGALLCTVRWYREQKFADLMKISLCVGLGMMTKLNAAIVAPPIALVFLIVFIKNVKNEGKSKAITMIKEFALFAAVCMPLGLWFQIRNYIKWHVPILYVHKMGNGALQYIGDQSFFHRICDFSLAQFSSPFEQWLRKSSDGVLSGYNEYNPLVALFKNSLFGEYINEKNYGLSIFPCSVFLCKVFFWIGVLVAAVCFGLMIYNLCKKCGLTPTEKTLFGSFYAFMMLNFYKMAMDYPFTCTMNFRYITPTVFIGALFLGLTLQNLNLKNKKIETVVKVSCTSVVSLFAVLSVIIYVFVCLPKK